MKAPLNAQKVIGQVTTWILAAGSILLLIFAAQLALWAAERSPPFVMLDYVIPPARAGESTVATAAVQRDLGRQCSAIFSRSFYDSKGTRWELTEGSQLMNSTAIENYNRFSPDKLSFSIRVPVGAQPGEATVMTVLDYECNPVHQTYPIPVVLTMKFEVLP